ncbi:MAG TPA: sigma-70 family RNA polymerase sigma factor [Thermoguttaceae bacterium]|nr:sigma-70 family RNA polymerase sigma factor [Thermoguttaceae bacterium]
MRATGSGDRRRWVLSVLERYEVPLLRFATRLLGDAEAARDVVQHVFLRLCDRSAEELHDRVGPWLFAVCRHKAIDVLRARGQTEPIGDGDSLKGFSREADPAVAAQQQELYRRINDLIERLPSAQREAVALWTEGFAYREIARITDRREGNVRVLVHRALKHLRESPALRRLLGDAETEGLVQQEETEGFVQQESNENDPNGVETTKPRVAQRTLGHEDPRHSPKPRRGFTA